MMHDAFPMRYTPRFQPLTFKTALSGSGTKCSVVRGLCAICAVALVTDLSLTLWESWADNADSYSSTEQQTACYMFNDYDILERASCLSGFFGDNVGLTMCRQCAADSIFLWCVMACP